MRNIFLFFYSFLVLSLLLSSCGPTYKLKEDQKVLRAVQTPIKGPMGYTEKSNHKAALASVYPQKANRYILGGLPYKSYLYNLRYKKYEKDSLNFQIVNEIVEKPAIYNEEDWQNYPELIERYFQNQGYFNVEVQEEIKESKKKVRLSYHIDTKEPHIINESKWGHFPEALNGLQKEIEERSLLQRGSKYQHTLLSEERKRIVAFLRDKGYYGVNLDNIHFELDTMSSTKLPLNSPLLSLGTSQEEFPIINIYTYLESINDNIPEDSLFQYYTIREVNIYGNYPGFGEYDPRVQLYNNYKYHHYHFEEFYVRPNILDKHIFLRIGQRYSESDYTKTLRQLSDLGIFRFTSIQIEDKGNREMTVNIYLEPADPYDFQASVEISGGDLYMAGTALQLGIGNKNFLKGANRLTVTASYALELGHDRKRSPNLFKQFFRFSQNVGVNASLEFPKFLLPVNQNIFNRRALARTSIDLGAHYLERIHYFKLFNLSTALQYKWKASDRSVVMISPLFINSLYFHEIDPSFQLRMDSVPAIKNAYQETFIHGERIEWQYLSDQKKHLFYTKVGLEEAGFLAHQVSKLFKGNETKISSYVRLDAELKKIFNWGNNQLVFRFYGGAGMPYGKNNVMPYIKQFYVGGPYSIRGWLPRALGPGSYYNKDQNLKDVFFLDQTGDIKLEFNAEYRFNLIRLFRGRVNLKGAGFVDAGNVWLSHADEMLPGADFKWNQLGQDLAISTGLGIRFDLGNIFVIRFDWAIPVKKPYVMDNYGWVWKDIDFTNKDWRKENINMNIAIGFPF